MSKLAEVEVDSVRCGGVRVEEARSDLTEGNIESSCRVGRWKAHFLF